MTSKAPELTPREIEVVRLIWEEYSTKEIALKIGISPRTLEAHRWNIAVKLGPRSTVGIIKFSLRAWLFRLNPVKART